jgi:hypothetical protein
VSENKPSKPFFPGRDSTPAFSTPRGKMLFQHRVRALVPAPDKRRPLRRPPRPTKPITVIAVRKGYRDGSYRKVGDVFVMQVPIGPDGPDFPSWVVEAER